MRHIFLALALAAATPALAQNEPDDMGQLSGLTVESANPSAFTVDMSDGHRYRVMYESDFRRMVPGKTFTIRYVTLNGYPTITALRPPK